MCSAVAITGASGYVGGLCAGFLRQRGVRVLTLGRRAGDDAPFALDGPHPDAAWFADHGVGALVHAAWDFSDRSPAFAFSRNVAGALRLLNAAVSGGARVIHLSSMSAWDGCPSVYGRAKRALEERVAARRGTNLRLGLVWAPDAGGMVGALRKLARLPVIPVPNVPAPVYLVEPAGIDAGIAAALDAPPGLYTLCEPTPHALPDLLRALAPGKPVVPVTWRLPWLALRLLEGAGLRLRSHSDSLLSLSRSNPSLVLSHAAQTAA
jgi:nucleoside-diphosphate-sugar epimerase